MIFKKKSFWAIVIIIILIAVTGIYFSNKTAQPKYDLVKAEKGELIQEVSITGSVEAAKEIDLAFEKSGKITYLPVKVKDEVKKNQMLAQLSNADIAAQLEQARAGYDQARAQLKQYQASLASAEAKLREYQAGSTPEEIQLAETTVNNEGKDLSDAQNNLTNVKDQAKTALEEDYNNALYALSGAISTAESSLYTLTDIQFSYFHGYTPDSLSVADAKAQAVESLLGQTQAGRWNNDNLSSLSGGSKGMVNQAEKNQTQENIDQAITQTKQALNDLKSAFNSIPITSQLSSSDQTSIATEKSNLNTEISTVNSRKQAILVQKTTNQSNISTAEAAVTTAENALATAQDQLKIKQAGYTAEQIASQEALVQQAEANVDSQKSQIRSALANIRNYQAQIGKTILRSPIKGVITKIEADLGEIIPANSPIVTIISDAQYQIKAAVPEVDIANIEINDIAQVTLDAYGSDLEFEAKVINIDPAETLIDNVPTYEVTFEFVESNNKIKPGMTANLDILTDKRDNVISLSQRSVLRKENKKIVRILEPDGINYKEVEVKTGLRGSNGQVEILEGVNPGDQIILSIREE